MWSISELRAAVARGVEILDCDWLISSASLFNPFEEFIDSLYKLREGYLLSGSGAANVVKLILNSLYGRFGLNPDRGLHKLYSLEEPGSMEAHPGAETLVINGKLYGMGQVQSVRQPQYVNVLFAAQITSGARMTLLDELERQGEDAIYCDTDSIMTRGTIPLREGLGGWRLEAADVEADLLGPKEYKLHNDMWGDKYVVKGVPDIVAEAYFRDGAARFSKALAIREAIRRGKQPSTWVETYRRRGAILPKRDPLPPWARPEISWTATRPYSVGELPGVLAGLYLPPDQETPPREKVHPRGPAPQQLELE